jgi:hypothetical protein
LKNTPKEKSTHRKKNKVEIEFLGREVGSQEKNKVILKTPEEKSAPLKNKKGKLDFPR